jgi:cation diffusion facilitator CzcD-associated flavoprotein CzcO
VHTANWDKYLDVTGKRVLNIGVGSSGVQTIPTIIDKVDRLYVVAVSAEHLCIFYLLSTKTIASAISRLDYCRV